MVRTARLEIRLVTEEDRSRFRELFSDPGFMVFSETGALDAGAADRRFDRMLALGDELSFCKQAVIEVSTGTTVGYVGVDYFEYRGERRLELGYRLVAGARGRGYATESARALLELAGETWHGELLALIDPKNQPSRTVIGKLGFEFVETMATGGGGTEIYSLVI
jgi:RimJ/RimL family protein N-acetyltransferase